MYSHATKEKNTNNTRHFYTPFNTVTVSFHRLILKMTNGRDVLVVHLLIDVFVRGSLLGFKSTHYFHGSKLMYSVFLHDFFILSVIT